ncbi:hypothetical protein TPHA_0E01880 [Tetrapisispora phaffii CBS 4417]|uniref:Protein SBE22 n=1 Tax=Tetrapisispora phaffii (strain ATCC 24235 / CBS 4417 / NBRC 1672 / NRRL Y-8282 / UCD 70-5) TaxID=1071381 RepID=G8BTQ3_TETPH|nr:hypothetical protein TPHA_0E01880 [Tetrapisispora phaffii CBS 4417]CCE63281.1 hypothetical protein TPHA_0E01880 [Tetrapisispora phaffii CBS 4417]
MSASNYDRFNRRSTDGRDMDFNSSQISATKRIGLGIAKRPGDNLTAFSSSNGTNLGSTPIKGLASLMNRFSIESVDSDEMDQSVISSMDESSFITNNKIEVSANDKLYQLANEYTVDDGNTNPTQETSRKNNDGDMTPRTKYFFQNNTSKSKSHASLPINHDLKGNYNVKNKSGSRSSTALPSQNNLQHPPMNSQKFDNSKYARTNNHPVSQVKNIHGASKGIEYSQSTPTLPNTYHQANNVRTGKPMTPSQKYRSHKSNASLRRSIRRKEKYYEQEDANDSMELVEADVNNSLIWNVPMASYSTSSFLDAQVNLNKKNNKSYLVHSGQTGNEFRPPSKFNIDYQRHSNNAASAPHLPAYDFSSMPLSPIPGINAKSDLQFIKETTQSLSSVYLQSSNRLSKSKLLERTDSAETLPIELKDASNNGMEDLILVSENKLNMVSHTRPSWLPPKDTEEKKKHESQISKSMSIASIDQLDRNKDSEERRLKDETNRAKFTLLLETGITRNSSIKTLKKLIWETSLPTELRYAIYDESLQSNIRFISSSYIESFPQMMQLFNNMSFPRIKEIEIEKLIESGITSKINGNYEISENLALLLQLKSISQQGLVAGDEMLFHHFLLDPSISGSLEKVWDIVNLIQLTCFNDVVHSKYDEKILEPNGVIYRHIGVDPSYKNEFNSDTLNFLTWWNILERIDHNLFMWVIDIIVIHNTQSFKNYPIKKEDFGNKSWEYYKTKRVVSNYKILLSFTLSVLLNYHFQYNDLKSLALLDDQSFCIPMPLDELVDETYVNSVFIKKWLQYYTKF